MLTPNNHTGCEFDILSSGAKIPTVHSAKTTCIWYSADNQTGCSLDSFSPVVNKWHYARIDTTNETYTYKIWLKIEAASKKILMCLFCNRY